MMRSRMLRAPAALGLAAALFAAAGVQAADKTGKSRSKDDAGQSEKMSGKLNVSDAEIRSLRERGYGWGDIGRALVISEESGKQLSDVTSLRDSGMDWNEIAGRYNVHFGMDKTQKGKRDTGRGGQSPTEGYRDAPAEGSGSGLGTSPSTAPGDTAPGGAAPDPSSPGGSAPGTSTPDPASGGTSPDLSNPSGSTPRP